MIKNLIWTEAKQMTVLAYIYYLFRGWILDELQLNVPIRIETEYVFSDLQITIPCIWRVAS